MGSDLPVPRGIIFQSNSCEITGSPDSPIFKSEGFSFSETIADYPCEVVSSSSVDRQPRILCYFFFFLRVQLFIEQVKEEI